MHSGSPTAWSINVNGRLACILVDAVPAEGFTRFAAFASSGGVLYAAGWCSGTMQFGTTRARTARGMFDGMVVRIDGTTGAVTAVVSVSGCGSDGLDGIAVDGTTNMVYAVGESDSRNITASGTTYVRPPSTIIMTQLTSRLISNSAGLVVALPTSLTRSSYVTFVANTSTSFRFAP